ncbi:hypothetical protein YDYSY3_58860 [Paenibacillus chitinolyticus]|uniref:hypothetical protein n=1 Tax=Paenibacillus chitinolyticus TaxID=79263 RepID=UPI0026E4DF0C|nr:hypothetical protein [Paenibacillus chitinolyticus]GKS14886.1 hypothetical protein YDYSY3_58860 [Paenibacillus chitinolyticus]
MEMRPVEWISSVLAAIAIVVSIFSWLAARRNIFAAERNALAAERSAAAATESNAQMRIQREALRRLYIRRLLKIAKQIQNAVLGRYQINSPFAHNPVIIDWESIKGVPQEINFADEIMIDIFTGEERDKIDEAWNSLNHLITTYGIDDSELQGMGYAGQVITNFDALIRLFENK